MAFGLNMKKIISNQNPVGKQFDIACLCWFTSTGKTMPLIVKIQDESGEIQKFDVDMLCLEEKNYCGIETIEYTCKIELNDQCRDVKLIYFKSNNKWKMVV